MWYLLVVSLIWAASFSLIKTFLVVLPPDVINACRLGLAFLVFLPFLRLRRIGGMKAAELAAIGALQLGAMCVFYTRSFALLKAHETALATVMTPLYVVVVQDLLERRIRMTYLGCAALSVAGTAVCLGLVSGGGAPSVRGLLLVQASNLCFACGQVWYRRAMLGAPGLTNAQAFAWCAAGAACVAILASVPVLWRYGMPTLSWVQAMVLLYLGVVASGLCFFLWNAGARRVNTAVLAVMNDLKIPLAILVALVVFRENVAGARLAMGGSMVLLAWWLSARVDRAATP